MRTVAVELLQLLRRARLRAVHVHLLVEPVVGHQAVRQAHAVRPHRVAAAIVEVGCAGDTGNLVSVLGPGTSLLIK